ncbi:DUF4129 domain-containing protein [Rufibacter sp. LB8]|uniref:DUF4129 domain-containing protein n=1 Tax=Rufibacter sp. LB8 TaxID=2777781 RepID=UPI00178C5D16|nr:DUF4129 domain-containing protein [Rufibacter sp. LB8]
MRPLFLFLFLLLGTCRLAWAAPEIQTSPVPVTQQKLELRQPNPQTLQSLQEDRAFQYEVDVRPDMSAWERFWRRVGQFFSEMWGNKNASPFWKFLMYAVAVGTTLFVILKLLQVDFVGLFSRKASGLALHYETYRENIHEIDFVALISEAETQGDYRRAIRLYYLKTLKQLTDQAHIDWKPGKTNRMYVYEIKENGLRRSFEQITWLFEVAWYGGSAVDAQRFEAAKQRFLAFDQSLLARA